MERLVIAKVCTSGGTKSSRAKVFFLSLLDDDVILLVGGMSGISNHASIYTISQLLSREEEVGGDFV